MKNRRREITGILIMAVSLLVFISLVGYDPREEPHLSPQLALENPMGILGVYLAHYLIKMFIGYSAFALPVLGLVWGWWIFGNRDLRRLTGFSSHLLGVTFLISISIALVGIGLKKGEFYNFTASGLLGGVLAKTLYDFLGLVGSLIVLLAGYLVIARSIFNWSFYRPFQWLLERFAGWRTARLERRTRRKEEQLKRRHTQELLDKIDRQRPPEIQTAIKPPPEVRGTGTVPEPDYRSQLDLILPEEGSADRPAKPAPAGTAGDMDQDADRHPQPEDRLDEEINVEEIVQEREVDIDSLKQRRQPRRKYQLPSTDLLATPVATTETLSRDELLERANFLVQSLQTFGVEGRVVNVLPGPVITLFEVEPAEGVRISKFTALADDLARVMEASRVRVIAPIPGKSSVGIEIPNRNPALVYFKSVINSEKFANAKSKLTLAVGKTTTGEIATMDLSQMPHLLIAGTTGSGKSVCLNTIICSLLYQVNPDQTKFVIIDPKKVEMSMYRALKDYHLLKMKDIDEPIITTTENSVLALRAVEAEMGRRYDLLADSVVRNIDEYNKKMLAAHQPILPYIIVVIDELADLMLISAKDVEAPIARLAQLARAVGIHLVIATQRPSVDVITGVIKANFPCRIAFQVASKIDSRTILDANGAEKLIGKGDMLYLGSGTAEPVRLHNAYLSLEEIEAIMKHIVEQPVAEELVLPSIREIGVSGLEIGDNVRDELFDEAVHLVITHQQGSISLIQRRLKVGYSRAARLIDEMEQAGIVGPFTGSKAREVLVDESYLDSLEY